jgi:transposase
MVEKRMWLDELMERLSALEAENQRLKAENAELRRRLEMNSANSHKPPSSDGYRKKTTQPGLPKGEKKSPGGKVGHPGKTLRQVEKPDKVQVHLPEACKVCGRAISAAEPHELLGKRQVFELPEAKLEVIEHRLGQITCCEQLHCGTYPTGVTASVQYGPGVRAFVTKLSVDHKMPLGQISRLFTDVYRYELNSETIEQALEYGYELAAGLEATVVEHLRQARVVHFDETGVRVAGKLHWLHTAGNAFYTHLFVHAKRGKKALHSEASVLKDFVGRAIHDCWASYFDCGGPQHGLCNAHLLRELQALAEAQTRWAETMRIFLLELYHQQRPLQDTAAQAARQRYQQILAQADQAEPPPELKAGKGRPKNTTGRNLLRRLLQYEEAVLAFAFVEGVPFTNNLAERDLRPAKIKQKVSGSFRTVQGAQVYARLQALISTCRKQDRNIFDTLRNLFALQPVSLIPG